VGASIDQAFIHPLTKLSRADRTFPAGGDSTQPVGQSIPRSTLFESFSCKKLTPLSEG